VGGVVAGWDEPAAHAANLMLECIELSTRSVEEAAEVASRVSQVLRLAFDAGVVDEFGQPTEEYLLSAKPQSDVGAGGAGGGGVAVGVGVGGVLDDEPWWKEEARRLVGMLQAARDTLRLWEDATRRASASLPVLLPRQGAALSLDDATWVGRLDANARPDLAALRVLLVLHREALFTQHARLDEQATRIRDVALLA
jgi:hypothetical protein